MISMLPFPFISFILISTIVFKKKISKHSFVREHILLRYLYNLFVCIMAENLDFHIRIIISQNILTARSA